MHTNTHVLHNTNHQQASASWRNLLGLVFALVVADLFMGSLGIIMRFPSEVRPSVGTHTTVSKQASPFCSRAAPINTPLSHHTAALDPFTQ